MENLPSVYLYCGVRKGAHIQKVLNQLNIQIKVDCPQNCVDTRNVYINQFTCPQNCVANRNIYNNQVNAFYPLPNTPISYPIIIKYSLNGENVLLYGSLCSHTMKYNTILLIKLHRLVPDGTNQQFNEYCQ